MICVASSERLLNIRKEQATSSNLDIEVNICRNSLAKPLRRHDLINDDTKRVIVSQCQDKSSRCGLVVFCCHFTGR